MFIIFLTCVTSSFFPSHLTSTNTQPCHPVTSLRYKTVAATLVSAIIAKVTAWTALSIFIKGGFEYGISIRTGHLWFNKNVVFLLLVSYRNAGQLSDSTSPPSTITWIAPFYIFKKKNSCYFRINITQTTWLFSPVDEPGNISLIDKLITIVIIPYNISLI